MTLLTDDITQLLMQWSNGDEAALDKLTPLVYAELRRLAARYMRRERPDHSLQATALVHEAFLELRSWRNFPWHNRAHFIGIAARIMRRILVDHARKRNADKRDPGEDPLSLSKNNPDYWDSVAVNEALKKMEKIYPRHCQVVDLKFFGGLSIEEIAEELRVSTATIERDWKFAKAWLHSQLSSKS